MTHDTSAGDEPEISVADAAKRLGVSSKTMHKWSRDPQHPCPPLRHYGGHIYRFRLADFEAWLRAVREEASK
jgi:predicted site-specific integrase-resolvase